MTTATENLLNEVIASVGNIDSETALVAELKAKGAPVDRVRLAATVADAMTSVTDAAKLSKRLTTELARSEMEDAARQADVARVRQAHARQLALGDGVTSLKEHTKRLKSALQDLQTIAADDDLKGKLVELDKIEEELANDEKKAAQKLSDSVTAVNGLVPFLALTGGVGPLGTLSMRADRIRPQASPELAFWSGLRASQLTFKRFDDFMKEVCRAGSKPFAGKPADECGKLPVTRVQSVQDRLHLPFPGVDQYRQLRAAAEVFLLTSCGVVLPRELDGTERERLGVPDTFGLAQLQDLFRQFNTNTDYKYLELLARQVGQPAQATDVSDPKLYACLEDMATMKRQCPCMIELIWSYWLEEGMQVQAINAIGLRFQNRRIPGRDGLARLHMDPLRPLNSLLWGYIQDDQHRLTIARRAYEYDHHYGITVEGKAAPTLIAADSRSKFLEAFHNLLHLTAKFYTQADNTQIIADGFPVLNALREVHQLLTDGGDNQWGDLPWTARLEMLVQQWILGRPEMEALFPGRAATVYDERWMRVVDAVKTAQGWTDTSITHFYRLATFGELLLLSVRFFPWGLAGIGASQAANWALYWRNEVQGYLHAYRAATGMDLAAAVDARPPSQLLKARLANTGS